jgi:hypothetical protein
MLTFEEARKETQPFTIPCYGAPEFMEEDEDFLFYKVAVPKVLIAAACESGCGGGNCGPCGGESEEE